MASCFCVGKLPSCTCDGRCRCECKCGPEKIEISPSRPGFAHYELDIDEDSLRKPPNCS